MISISQVADRIGEHICKMADLESEVKKICFGVEVIMMMMISILSTFVFGGALGVFRETLIVTFAAFVMKFIIGGSHLSGFFRCFIYSIIFVLSGAWLCSIYQIWLNPPTVLLLLLLNILVIHYAQLAPSYRTFDNIQVFKRKLTATVLVLISAILCLEFFTFWSSGALIGFSISILNISPAGANFVKWLEHITKQGGAGQ